MVHHFFATFGSFEVHSTTDNIGKSPQYYSPKKLSLIEKRMARKRLRLSPYRILVHRLAEYGVLIVAAVQAALTLAFTGNNGMRRTFRRHFKKVEPPKYRVNQFITAPELRVIDGEGVNLGVLATPVALAHARALGLDLVEVFPKAVPPVAKILNYGSFKYQQDKLERQQKVRSKKVEIKGIRLSLGIGQHDRDVRIEQAREFIDGGDRVQIEMVLRGRERQHTDLARENLHAFIAALGDDVAIDQPLSNVGGRLTIMIKKR